MRKAFTLVLLCVLSQPQMFADEGDARSLPSQRLILTKAIEQESRRSTLSLRREQGAQPQQPAPESRGWVERHPALFGALVGAGAGAVSSIPRWTELYCATGGDEDCLFHGGAGVLFGAGVGAGVGSLVGYFVGK